MRKAPMKPNATRLLTRLLSSLSPRQSTSPSLAPSISLPTRLPTRQLFSADPTLFEPRDLTEQSCVLVPIASWIRLFVWTDQALESCSAIPLKETCRQATAFGSRVDASNASKISIARARSRSSRLLSPADPGARPCGSLWAIFGLAPGSAEGSRTEL